MIMFKEMLCTNCLDIIEANKTKKNESYTINNDTITVEISVYKCPICAEEMHDPNNSSEGLEKAYNEYRIRHNILTPEEIKSTRERYGLSQRQLAKLLGWSHATISQLESGALPSANQNNTLALLSTPTNILELLERNSYDLSVKEYKNIHEKINNVIENNKNNLIYGFADRLFSSSPSEYTGYRPFNFDKVTQLIKFLAKREHNLFKLRLLKFMFYSDFLSFKRRTRSITGLKYKHLPMGPVPNDYDLLLDLIEKTGEINKEIVVLNDYDNPGEKISSTGQVDNSLFDNDELKILEDVYNFTKNYNSRQISDLSHNEDAWKCTNHLEFISYKYADTLTLD